MNLTGSYFLIDGNIVKCVGHDGNSLTVVTKSGKKVMDINTPNLHPINVAEVPMDGRNVICKILYIYDGKVILYHDSARHIFKVSDVSVCINPMLEPNNVPEGL